LQRFRNAVSFPMLLSENEALERVLASAHPLEIEYVLLWDCAGRILANDLIASVAIPRFDNSSMDGYAVRATETMAGAALAVVGEQVAGPDARLILRSGEAIRIFTGAPIPLGADAVIMQEDVDRKGPMILVREPVTAGENIRVRGGDLCEGQRLLAQGTALMGPQLALVASQGLTHAHLFRRPNVAVIATGSELKAPGQILAPGEIFETNRILLSTLVANSGATPRLFDVVPDQLAAHLETFGEAMSSDVVIVAGGVSVGEKDLVKAALAELGARLELWRVAIRPGKPFLFGRLGETLIFGLPGNPVSAFVTFLVFVRPALWKLSGRTDYKLPQVRARSRRYISNRGDRPHYLRGTLKDGEFDAVGKQESHALFALAQATALCRLEANQSAMAGEELNVIPVTR
jgi:molybdopterin molybdotransferase